MDVYTHYEVTHNPTGQKWVAQFEDQFDISVASAVEIRCAGGLTPDQAARQIDIWNRAEAAFRSEFSYKLHREQQTHEE